MIETCALIDVVDFVDKARPSLFFPTITAKKKLQISCFFPLMRSFMAGPSLQGYQPN
jgi:hypothetical protein